MRHRTTRDKRRLTRLRGGAAVIALSATTLAACSDSTSDDPLPLSDGDSDVIVEDAPIEGDEVDQTEDG